MGLPTPASKFALGAWLAWRPLLSRERAYNGAPHSQGPVRPVGDVGGPYDV